jgi:hypothetical protein
MSDYHDYRYRFQASNVAQAVAVLAALRAAGALDGEHPTNMLGDALDATGNPTSPVEAIFLGRQSGSYIYIHVRATTPPEAIGVDLGAYGMEPVSEAESAAVLGVWF